MTLKQIVQTRAAARSGHARELRLAADVSLAEVAAEVAAISGQSVSLSALSRWERGLARPKGARATAYATVLTRLERARAKPPGTASAAFAPEGEAPEASGGTTSPKVEGLRDV